MKNKYKVLPNWSEQLSKLYKCFFYYVIKTFNLPSYIIVDCEMFIFHYSNKREKM